MTDKKTQTKSSLKEDIKNIYQKITEDFHSVIDSINFEDRLSASIFNILKKYITYDVTGLFFNESDETSRNIFNFSFPKNNITIEISDIIRDKFFDEIEKYKRINEIQCNLIDGDIAEKTKINYDSLKTIKLIPFFYGEKITGGIFLGSTKKFTKKENDLFKILESGLNVICKMKYILNEQSKHSLIDPMTGLYNKQEFENHLDLELNKARRYIFNFTLAMIDIDYLSKLNKNFGEEYGDFVLTELSKILKQTFRRTDTLYRYGSEELIVMLPYTPITKAVIPIERLRSAISNYVFKKNDKESKITVSIGLCANFSQFERKEQLLDALGSALTDAKKSGRNKVSIFE